MVFREALSATTTSSTICTAGQASSGTRARADFRAIVKREYEIFPARTLKHAMRAARLALHTPSDPQ
jgi:hypothetical protein